MNKKQNGNTPIFKYNNSYELDNKAFAIIDDEVVLYKHQCHYDFLFEANRLIENELLYIHAVKMGYATDIEFLIEIKPILQEAKEKVYSEAYYTWFKETYPNITNPLFYIQKCDEIVTDEDKGKILEIVEELAKPMLIEYAREKLIEGWSFETIFKKSYPMHEAIAAYEALLRMKNVMIIYNGKWKPFSIQDFLIAYHKVKLYEEKIMELKIKYSPLITMADDVLIEFFENPTHNYIIFNKYFDENISCKGHRKPNKSTVKAYGLDIFKEYQPNTILEDDNGDLIELVENIDEYGDLIDDTCDE